MSFHFSIATGLAIPIYRQITDQVRLAIAAGKLTPGHQLPSVRSLAEELVVNVNTVAKAYAELLRQGLVESQPGRGVFIAERRNVYSEQEIARRLEAPLQALLSEAAGLGIDPATLQSILNKRLTVLLPPSVESRTQHSKKDRS